jgi:prepilin-type N-terminal cleavage/methylation domain-containing protein
VKRDDEGFTLVETMVSIAIIAATIAALGLFLVQTIAVGGRQSDSQSAVQVAAAAMERVAQLSGDAVIQGRDQTTVQNQWTAPLPGVAPYLAMSEAVWDPADHAAAQLPVTTERVTVGGRDTNLYRTYYVGACWEPKATGAAVPCLDVTAADRTGLVAMYRVVVAITWTAKDCQNGLCSYVAATLVGRSGTDLTFQ